jgi:hypothetical protein
MIYIHFIDDLLWGPFPTPEYGAVTLDGYYDVDADEIVIDGNRYGGAEPPLNTYKLIREK